VLNAENLPENGCVVNPPKGPVAQWLRRRLQGLSPMMWEASPEPIRPLEPHVPLKGSKTFSINEFSRFWESGRMAPQRLKVTYLQKLVLLMKTETALVGESAIKPFFEPALDPRDLSFNSDTQILRFNETAKQSLPQCVFSTPTLCYLFAGGEETAKEVRDKVLDFVRLGGERISAQNLEWCKQVYACTTLPGTSARTQELLRESKGHLQELLSSVFPV
jgi:hypothetical protein